MKIGEPRPNDGESFFVAWLRDGTERGRRGTKVVLDCIGFSAKREELCRDIVGAPVVLARSILGRIAGELS